VPLYVGYLSEKLTKMLFKCLEGQSSLLSFNGSGALRNQKEMQAGRTRTATDWWLKRRLQAAAMASILR
jgi:hypothetical protein